MIGILYSFALNHIVQFSPRHYARDLWVVFGARVC